MKKMLNFIKKAYKDFICVALILASLVLCITRYRISLVRIGSALKDFFCSLKFYFLAFFDTESAVTVTQLPGIEILKLLPYDVDEILRRLGDMWKCVFNADCFLDYITGIALFLNNFSMFLILFIPIALIAGLIIKIKWYSPNNKKHAEKTRFLLFFERKVIPLYLRVKEWLADINKIFKQRHYKKLFILVWLVNLNLLTVAIEFLAYYFYFAMSIDLINIPLQAVKLLLDIIIILSSAPLLFWLVVSCLVIGHFSKKIAYRRLDHREACNREFIKAQPIIELATGSMGTGKTTLDCDITLSINIMFREKALELMLKCQSMFPNFKWILFEDWLKKLIRYGKVYNLTTAKMYVRLREKRFVEKDFSSAECFDYDLELYRFCFEDGLKIYSIFDVLEDYACLYFIYTIESSLIVSNYSIRDDAELIDIGHFPIWNNELFRLSVYESAERTKFSHILDYDAFRLGKTVIENNPAAASFEFGIVSISEFGKERGNTLTLQEVKKGDDKTNQKNDLFTYELKMCRHKATVMNYPFVVFVSDEQRPESVGADIRDLLSILHIREKKPFEILCPFFFPIEIIYDFLSPKYDAFLVKRRHARSDYSFPMFLIDNIFTSFQNYYRKQYNIFGCSDMLIDLERGTMDGGMKREKYYIMSKKIYSDRFSTDCNRCFFEERLKETPVGLINTPTYSGTVASADELHSQNSYFISDMEKLN